MTTTYYRIHDAAICAPEDLTEESEQVSRVWTGTVARRCEADGCIQGQVLVDEVLDDCSVCRGAGVIEIEEQRGVSCCRSLRALEAYLAGRGPYRTEETVLVELEGEVAQEEDVDAEYGAVLVRPTRIVSVRSVDELTGIDWQVRS